MMQPGSLRDSAVSFSKIAATSDSRPIFAIQITANTTIPRSDLLSCRDAACRACFRVQIKRRRGHPRLYMGITNFATAMPDTRLTLTACQSQLAYELRQKNRLLTIRT